MSLGRLEVSGLRNLRSASLKSCGRVNVISGPNGSGKTSLLEAIYLLGMGRSFRGARLTPLISRDMDACTIYGELVSDSHKSLALLRTRQGELEFRVDRMPAASAADLASALPLQLINSDSFVLLDGGPKARRQFMDWGVFHVKPVFIEYWRRAQRCLKQRNSLLRQQARGGRGRIGASDLAGWDLELSACAEDIDGLRAQYTEHILPIFNQILMRLTDGLPELTLEYQRGWKAGEVLHAALAENFDRDVRFATTTVGPHRANLDIRVNGLPALEVLSRGQQKLVVSALRLAQGRYLAEQTGARCVYLIDDLPAELDRHHRKAFCELLDEIGCQVFITGVDADMIEYVWRDQGAVRRFHVKQGQIFCN